MATQEFASVDLNLLVTLDAVLREGNVHRAALRLGVTQSAVSHALRRLRAQVGDALVLRTPKGVVPTPRAERLAAVVRRCLSEIEAAVHAQDFDLATTQRTFTLSATDAVAFILLPALMRHLERTAPGLELRVVPQSMGVPQALQEGTLDLALGVFSEAPASLRIQSLYRQGFTCLMRQGHPLARHPLSLERYLELGHVLVAPTGTPGSLIDDALARQGLRRRIALVLPHFLVAPAVIAETDLVLTAPERLAHHFARFMPLQLLPPPIEFATFTVSQMWSERFHEDPGHIWLRQALVQLARAGATSRDSISSLASPDSNEPA